MKTKKSFREQWRIFKEDVSEGGYAVLELLLIGVVIGILISWGVRSIF